MSDLPDHLRRAAAALTAAAELVEVSAGFESVDLVDDLSAFLENLASQTGAARFRHAAAVLRADGAGRPPKNDVEALAEVRRLVGTGRLKVRGACLAVARRLPPEGATVESVADRLRKKHRRAHQ